MDSMGNLNISELMPLISKLAQNPEAMSAISGLMGASVGQQKQSAATSSNGGADPFSTIMGLMGSAQKSGAEGGGKPPRSTGASVFGSQDEIKNRILLLNAVRPYLSEERRQRLETVIKLLRLAEIGALSAVLGGK